MRGGIQMRTIDVGAVASAGVNEGGNVLHNQKILMTGATGKIAFPIARALAKHNEVWGAARLGKPGDRDKLSSAGIRPLQLDVSTGDFSAIPADFTYVFHAAVDTGAGEWRRCVRTNAHNSGNLPLVFRLSTCFLSSQDIWMRSVVHRIMRRTGY